MNRSEKDFTFSINPHFLLWGAALFVVGLFIYFYPPIYGYRDEALYLAMAYVLRAGTIFIDKTPFPMLLWIDRLGHQLPLYPLGNSILLIPFTWISWKAVFMMGCIVHILNWRIFTKIAKLLECGSPLASMLFLFFPPFIFYSRTLMSDLPSLTLFLGAFYIFYPPKLSDWIAGALLGLSLFFRVSNVLILIPFILGLIWNGHEKRTWGSLLSFLFGLVPFLIMTSLYNYYVYGAAFLFGYSKLFTGMNYFTLDFFKEHLVHYAMSLNVMYPLMLILALLNRKIWKIEIMGSILIFYLFFSAYYFHDQFPGRMATWAFGARFLFPVFPFLILAYADTLNSFLQRLPAGIRVTLLSGLGIGLCVSAVVVSQLHQKQLIKQDRLKQMIYKTTPVKSVVIYDANSAELMQGVWGRRYYHKYDGILDMIRYLNRVRSGSVYLIVRGVQSGNGQIISPIQADLADIKFHFQVVSAGSESELLIYQLRPLPDHSTPP